MAVKKAVGGKIKANKSLASLVNLLGDQNKIVTPRLTRFLLDNAAGITYDDWVIERVMAELVSTLR